MSLPDKQPRLAQMGGHAVAGSLMHSRRLVRAAVVVLWFLCVTVRAGVPSGLEYTGTTAWDPDTATLTFHTSGTMPDTRDGFYWNIPPEVKTIVIAAEVTVTGGFRVGYRDPSNPLKIVGKNRETSVIHGTDTERWTTRNRIAESDKWKHGAISVLADAVVAVSNLTSRNPRGYHMSGYANRSVIHVSRCTLVDTRSGLNNNSDGFTGAAGSSIRDSLISTGDDGIKIYRDMTIENVTIQQHRNGAPIQFGWGGNAGAATANIRKLTIKGVDPEHLYNMAPFTWEAGTTGTRTVTVNGLLVELRGRIYNEDTRAWEPASLFELKPKGCTLKFRAVDADIGGLEYGRRDTMGELSINGSTLP